jgi:hypothetical protein
MIYFVFVVLEKRWRYFVPEYLWPNILFSYYVKKESSFLYIFHNVSIHILYTFCFLLLGSKMKLIEIINILI